MKHMSRVYNNKSSNRKKIANRIKKNRENKKNENI